VQAGHRERQRDGDEPTRRDHHDDRPWLEQRGRQCGGSRSHTDSVAEGGRTRGGLGFPQLSRGMLGCQLLPGEWSVVVGSVL
jgi:hypothetical protein